MKFKIRHEQKWILNTLLISLLVFFAIVFLAVFGIPLLILYIDIAVFFLTMMLSFFEQAVGTYIIIEDSEIIIKYIIGKKHIPVNEITNLYIETYERMRRRGHGAAHPEHRMRMTISLANEDDIVLTDKATKSGFSLGNPENLPDDEVNLYMAYTVINTMIN